MFISSFYSKSLIWVPVSFLSLLVPCTFSFFSPFVVFTFSFILRPYRNISVSILLTSVLNSASDSLLSLHHLVLFLEFWSVLLIGRYFFVWTHLLHCKEWSLRYLPGQGNPSSWVVALYMDGGGGPRGTNATCSALSQLSVTSPTIYKQIGPSWCWFSGQ